MIIFIGLKFLAVEYESGSIWPSGQGIGLKIRRSGVRFLVLAMCRCQANFVLLLMFIRFYMHLRTVGV